MKHPITPPPELLEQWLDLPLSVEEQLEVAARWGADQELEACCDDILQILAGIFEDKVDDWNRFVELLRDGRRPSPNEQAIDALETSLRNGYIKAEDGEIIRRALESLPDPQD